MSVGGDADAIGVVMPWAHLVASGRVAVALVRHGRTAWNQERRFLGITDIPLDHEGREQARTLAGRIGRPFSRVYSSPLARAWQTAEHLDPQPLRVHALHELAQGQLEGLHAPDAMVRFPEFFAQWAQDPVHARTPGGESLGECRDRAMTALRSIVAAHRPGEVVAVVTHQMVIASVTCTLLGQELTGWRSHGVGNACVTVLGWDGHEWEVGACGWEGCQVDPGPGPGVV